MKSLANSRGQSLVQILVALGIMGVFMSAMVSTQVAQTRENRALNEKLASLELERNMTTAETDGTTCSHLFDAANTAVAGPITFDPSAVSQTSPKIVKIKSVPGLGSAPPVAQENSLASPLSSSLFIPTGGMSVQVTGPDSANLVINFDQNKLVRSIHNATMPLAITTTGTSTKTVTGCHGNFSPSTALTVFKAGDILGMSPSTQITVPGQYMREFTFPYPTQSYEQNLLITAFGVWDVSACGGNCAASVNLRTVINGVTVSCGQNGYYGLSGPYNSVSAGQVSCVVHVPANATVQVIAYWDGRNGAFPNFNYSGYSTEHVGENPNLVTIYSLK